MYIMPTSWGYGVYKGSMLQMEFETEIEAYDYIASLKRKEIKDGMGNGCYK